MNYNPRIISALTPIGIEVIPDFYDAKKKRVDKNGNELPDLKEWIVFNYVTESPILHGDDEDIEEKTLIDVHHFTKDKAKAHKIKELIKKSLRYSGFTIESTMPPSYENDTGFYHTTVTISDTDSTEV
ncbi:MAG: hypothetical protein IKB88_02180 [Clostridia bacterium]|nr:hypothetical protein [Clostridia bacterium]